MTEDPPTFAMIEWVFSFAFSSFTAHFALDNTNVLSKSNTISKSWTHGGSGQDIPEFRSPVDMLLFSPIGMFTALFRPLPGEVLNIFGIFSGLENLVLLFLVYLAWKRGRHLIWSGESGVIWALSLVLFWAFIYGFVSSQNLGSAVRFKLQILPILLGLTLYLAYPQEKKDRQTLPI